MTEDGPHLNDRQFQKILEHTRYHIWCAQNDAFYLETERYRRCLLAGALPVKVLFHPRPTGLTVPFSYLLLEEKDAFDRLMAFDFPTMRQRFTEDYLALPTLEQAVAEFLAGEPATGGRDRGSAKRAS